MKSLNFLLVVSLFFFGCKKKIFDISRSNAKSSAPVLKNLPFPFGAAIDLRILEKNEQYKSIVTSEFNSLTAETAMKFDVLHPEEKRYYWEDADAIVTFAQKNNMRVHGHTLNWYGDVPGWVSNYSGKKEDWERIFKDHIQTVVKHFKGKVASWDVVNEAFGDDGVLTRNIWMEHLGVDYIARAFQYAHEADPNALLFYNDYGQEFGAEYRGLKRNAIISMVNDFKRRGIPIHGLGLQMHTRYNQPDSNIAIAIKTAAATGLKVHISELDVALNPEANPSLSYSQQLAEMQAAKYKSVVKLYNGIPRAQQFGITIWNVTDGDSWFRYKFDRPDWPLPFDKDYTRKAAYHGILDGVK